MDKRLKTQRKPVHSPQLNKNPTAKQEIKSENYYSTGNNVTIDLRVLTSEIS